MANLTEIRWHGRGGQGAKTASILLGKVAARTGKDIQAFPEYGPERMGAPILAFNRISDEEITIHCQVAEPDIVVVLDPTLLEVVDVTEGVSDNGKIIVNSQEDAETVKEKINFAGDVWTVDAYRVAREKIGRPIPNTPMIGALIGATELLPIEELINYIEPELKKKFSSKPQVVDKNIAAIKRTYKEVS
ncbi:MAG: 2-oxoacid:acceptor oxidoreductase family protein [Halanaerobiales bacterium]